MYSSKGIWVNNGIHGKSKNLRMGKNVWSTNKTCSKLAEAGRECDAYLWHTNAFFHF